MRRLSNCSPKEVYVRNLSPAFQNFIFSNLHNHTSSIATMASSSPTSPLITNNTTSFSGNSGMRGRYSSHLNPELITFIQEQLPENAPHGDVLKPGSRSTVTEVIIHDEVYVLKLYKRLSLRRRLRYALTQTRARQSWQMGITMAELGIPVACPLAILEWFSMGIPTHSSLLMHKIDGPSLTDFIKTANPDATAHIVTQLSNVFSLMKRHRITHGDLKSDNILIDKNLQPHFIDLDASIKHRHSRSYEKHQQKDQIRFMKNWQKLPEVAQAFSCVFDRSR